MPTDDAIRASDADREHAVGLIRDGYACGRLTLDEFDERTTVAFASRTGAAGAPAGRAARRPPAGPGE
jgi:hypothetical protein